MNIDQVILTGCVCVVCKSSVACPTECVSAVWLCLIVHLHYERVISCKHHMYRSVCGGWNGTLNVPVDCSSATLLCTYKRSSTPLWCTHVVTTVPCLFHYSGYVKRNWTDISIIYILTNGKEGLCLPSPSLHFLVLPPLPYPLTYFPLLSPVLPLLSSPPLPLSLLRSPLSRMVRGTETGRERGGAQVRPSTAEDKTWLTGQWSGPLQWGLCMSTL